MSEFDDIVSLKNSKEKTDKFTEFYKEKVKIDDWLINTTLVSIINFKDRIEYKKYGKFHRINGPAIDYKDENLDTYYYKGIKFETKEDWKKATIKEVRKIKLKKLVNKN